MLISLQAKIDIVMDQEFVFYSKEKEKLICINKKLRDELDCCKVCILKLMPFLKVLKDTCFFEGSEKTCHIDPKEFESIDSYCKILTGTFLNDLNINNNDEQSSEHSTKISKSSNLLFEEYHHMNENEITTLDGVSVSDGVSDGTLDQINNGCKIKNSLGNTEDTDLYVVMDTSPLVLDKSKNEKRQVFSDLIISEEDHESPQKHNSFRIKSTHNSTNNSIDNNNLSTIDYNFPSNNELFLDQNSEWNIINADDVIHSNNVSTSPNIPEISTPLASRVSELLAVDEHASNDLLYNETSRKSSDIIKAPLKINVLRKNRAGYGQRSLKEKTVIMEIPKVNKRPLSSEELSNYENGKLEIRLVDLAEAFDAYKLDQDSGNGSSKRLIEYITIPDLSDEKSTIVLSNSDFNDNNQPVNEETQAAHTSDTKTSFLQKLLLRKRSTIVKS